MKKKINVSVTQLLHKNKTKQTSPGNDTESGYIIFDSNNGRNINTNKPVRFQEMYKIMRINKSEKSSYDTKKTAPHQSNRTNQNIAKTISRIKHRKSLSDIQNAKATLIEPNPKRSCNILQNMAQSQDQNQENSHIHFKKLISKEKGANLGLKTPPNQSQYFPQSGLQSNKQNEHLQSNNIPKQKLIVDPPSPKMIPINHLQQQYLTFPKSSPSNHQSVWPLQSKFQSILKEKINHELHSHLCDNECFLNEEEIRFIMEELGYSITLVPDSEKEAEKLFKEMLMELEYQIYGGVPSLNLLNFLKVVDGAYSSDEGWVNKDQGILKEKIIDNNLKFSATLQQQKQIHGKYSFLKENCNQEPQRSSSLKKGDDFQEIGLEKYSSEFSSTEWKSGLEHDSEIQELKDKLNKALSKVQEKKIQEQQDLKNNRRFEVMPKKPILSVDVNLGEGVSEKIIVCEGETAREVSERLMKKYQITQQIRIKFQKMLEAHLKTMLWKIEEVSEQLLTDRDQLI